MSAKPEQGDPVSPPGTPPGIIIPRIMLPQLSADLYRWSVIACDQHTASLAYWQETMRIVAGQPSTLNLILPEYYLEHPDPVPLAERIRSINQTMTRYLEAGLLRTLDPGCILIDRATPDHSQRLGLLLAVDLECYDFTPGNRKLIRATEGTVVSRIPPRAAVRRDALLELPHVQVLIDDPQRSVIEPLFEHVQSAGTEPLYNTPLMQNGGSVRGWFFPDGSVQLKTALQRLKQLDSLQQHDLLMAVGDGNHSLATAKAHWQELRSQVSADHPARYALVEVINLHDAGLTFEPVHRIVSGILFDDLVAAARKWFAGRPVRFLQNDSLSAVGRAFAEVSILQPNSSCRMVFDTAADGLPVALIQSLLDHLAGQDAVHVDYIHGENEVRRLTGEGHIGMLLPAMSKYDLFPVIARDGVLPRKTFSMGESYEKRYYLECRRIR